MRFRRRPTFVRRLGDGLVATIEGDALTLMDPGRIGLAYRASE